MTTLATGYDPTAFEARLYAHWEASGVFAPTGKGAPYTILLPPPNVTGTLHMGHAFQHTLQDALIRYHRMRGYDTLWQMGTDHAGIATEMVVSRNLALEGNGETRDSLGRERFIGKVWEWKQHSGDTIERQMRRLGTSGDWSRSVFTMDPMAAEAVVEAFVRLHREGLIYRGQRLVNWDPVLQTAISDLEVVNEEEDGFLWSIRYPLADGASYEHIEVDADGVETLRETRDYLVVATTRPETMLGDTAVMVHPDDPRYASLVGKTVALPLTGRTIPIIADAYVDRAFGTGVVKVTPAHDFNDYAVWQRHVSTGVFDKLPNRGLINIFTPDARVIGSSDPDANNYGTVAATAQEAMAAGIAAGTVIPSIPDAYRGLDRYAARKAVLADLERAEQLVETKTHKLQVPRGDRTGQVIEPYLTDQWFVKMDGFAKRGLELVEQGAVKFVPPNWINTYRHWLENIQDWCISRQLWWGHRIPAWYDEAGNVYVGHDEAEVRTGHGLGAEVALTQDNDVLETWFSSALWPLSTMGWPDPQRMRERGYDRYVPSSVLVTGFDIIFFWVARMIFMTDHLVGQDRPDATDAQRVPFRDVYITGLVRDAHGQKMSKSKGNVLDPIDIIDGIALEDLVAKRTSGLMQPKMAEKIARATRKEFPDGIPAFGADALRFTIAALAGHGRDIKFDLGRAEGYKNFCNKLWNATRFALMNLGEATFTGAPQPRTDAEKWILVSLARTASAAEEHFASYRFDLLAQALYEFTWNQVCDWFLELAKPALNGDDADTAASTRHTLAYVLESLLRLLHPLIPFVTEELWQAVAPRLGKSGSIMVQEFPTMFDVREYLTDEFEGAEADIEWLKAVVSAVRRIRSELGVSPAKQVSLLLRGGTADDAARAARHAAQLRFLCRLERIETIGGEPPAAAPAVVGELQLFVPLEGLVDLGAERVRLDREIAKVAAEKDKSAAKLAKFGANVPAAVVEQERGRLADWSAKLDALQAQRARLG
ncbi:valine--tRNA ligase [Cognatiluteimonas weifangensis]|uniref:Valine--tRNA ligase n=1 Tax=Cognatiluteimonas weifangensis TaxID=2303539 RepID=A0A372DMH3_9GAMM|nr:valine--tRNA ligase [Luteimonas weifangensis]RFP60532.1 valine--tRNA ligase [Luteimonas weifangensis]